MNRTISMPFGPSSCHHTPKHLIAFADDEASVLRRLADPAVADRPWGKRREAAIWQEESQGIIRFEAVMENIFDRHRTDIAALCRRTGARRLDAFGSAVRHDFDAARSDIDFLVQFDEMPPAKYAQAYFDLKEGLEAFFGRPVDLITDSSLDNPFFRDRITAERRSVYAR